jgi:hypothetical protein
MCWLWWVFRPTKNSSGGEGCRWAYPLNMGARPKVEARRDDRLRGIRGDLQSTACIVWEDYSHQADWETLKRIWRKWGNQNPQSIATQEYHWILWKRVEPSACTHLYGVCHREEPWTSRSWIWPTRIVNHQDLLAADSWGFYIHPLKQHHSSRYQII